MSAGVSVGAAWAGTAGSASATRATAPIRAAMTVRMEGLLLDRCDRRLTVVIELVLVPAGQEVLGIDSARNADDLLWKQRGWVRTPRHGSGRQRTVRARGRCARPSR